MVIVVTDTKYTALLCAGAKCFPWTVLFDSLENLREEVLHLSLRLGSAYFL